MADRKVARRYAEALFAVAAGRQEVDAVEAELRAVVEALWGDTGFMTLLSHPRIRTARKVEQVRRLLETRVSATTLHYLILLVERRRIAVLAESLDEFSRLADEARGMINAEVTTAVSATREQEQALRAALERVSGKHIRLKLQTDPALVAGLVVRIGDQVIDASARSRLLAARNLMREARVTR